MKKTKILTISLFWLLAFLSLTTVKVSQAQVSVTVTPAQADVPVNLTQQFIATVSGTPDQSVTWSVIPGGFGIFPPGTIDATGLYTAPPNADEPPFETVKATSVADPTASGTAAVIVRGIADYTQRNANNDLWGINNGDYLQFGWTKLPPGTTQIVFSRATSSSGPWTEVFNSVDPDVLTPEKSIVYTNADPVPPDGANDYFYKMDAFSATGLLLKSYSPVFIPKVVQPL